MAPSDDRPIRKQMAYKSRREIDGSARRNERRNERSRIIQGILPWVAGFGLALGMSIPIRDHYVRLRSLPPLGSRIESVESAISSLKTLESELEGMKSDMKDTAVATEAIKSEYEKAKELEKLTDKQLSRIRSAVVPEKTLIESAGEWFIGFVSGVAASILAAFIHSSWVQRSGRGRQEAEVESLSGSSHSVVNSAEETNIVNINNAAGTVDIQGPTVEGPQGPEAKRLQLINKARLLLIELDPSRALQTPLPELELRYLHLREQKKSAGISDDTLFRDLNRIKKRLDHYKRQR